MKASDLPELPSMDERAPAVPAATEQPANVRRPLPPFAAWLLAHRHVVALAAGVGLIVLFLLLPADEDSIVRYGYGGVFLTTLIATGSLVLPVPYLLVVAVAGTLLNPLLVGVVAGLASSLGELTGYLIGYAGLPLVRRGRGHERLERWVRQWGFSAVFILAVVPNPLFDVAGITAGTLGMPVRAFWLACFAGKTIRLAGIAWLASRAPGILAPWLG